MKLPAEKLLLSLPSGQLLFRIGRIPFPFIQAAQAKLMGIGKIKNLLLQLRIQEGLL